MCRSTATCAVSGATLVRPGIQLLMQDSTWSLRRLIGPAATRRTQASSSACVSPHDVGRRGDLRAARRPQGHHECLVPQGPCPTRPDADCAVAWRLGVRGAAIRTDMMSCALCVTTKSYRLVSAGSIKPRQPQGVTARNRKRLNRDGIAGPCGQGWAPSTINGNRERGTASSITNST